MKRMRCNVTMILLLVQILVGQAVDVSITNTIALGGKTNTVYCFAAKATPDSHVGFGLRIYCTHLYEFRPGEDIGLLLVNDTSLLVISRSFVWATVTTDSGDWEKLWFGMDDLFHLYVAVIGTRKSIPTKRNHLLEVSSNDNVYVTFDQVGIQIRLRCKREEAKTESGQNGVGSKH
jgi:hypothetical protein